MTTDWKTREYERTPLPPKLCNTDRLFAAMTERGIDGVVSSTQSNGLYLTSLASPQSAPEHVGHFSVIFSRRAQDHPIMVMPDIHVGRLQYQPTWIEDIRTFASILLPLYAPVEADELRRFVPAQARESDRGHAIAERYYPWSIDGVVEAISDLGLADGRIAFDDILVGQEVASRLPGVTAVSGQGLLRYVRAEKTDAEIELLRKASAINQRALERAVADWSPGMTWHDLSYVYHMHAVRLGGLFDSPGAMAMANPDGDDPAWHANSHLDDFELRPGTNIMFDAHGRYNGYCWDGGKTWVVGGEPSPKTQHLWAATMAAVEEIQTRLEPGQKISEAVATGLATYEKFGVPTGGVLIFFHGLGLDHLDQELMAGHRSDWTFTDNMVISTHIQVPGSDRERVFIEDIAVVKESGPDRFFTWDDSLLLG
jgi:Xaa-Pro aminopeptidase